MSSEESRPPGHLAGFGNYGWRRNDGVVTFGPSFGNYVHTDQDDVLLIPLGSEYTKRTAESHSGYLVELCGDCLGTVVSDSSTTQGFDRIPCVVTFVPRSRLAISSGGGTNPSFSIRCTCETATHQVNRPRPIRPNRQKQLKIVLV